MRIRDIIEFPYYERGERIVQARDLYLNPGNIKVISSGTEGPMGYYNKANFTLMENSFVYAIEGYAGMVSIYQPQDIWLTDVAGVVNVKQEYIDEYGKENIAIFLQYYFLRNRHNNGQQPKFTLKRCLDIEIDLSIINVIKNVDTSELEYYHNLFERISKHYNEMLVDKGEIIYFSEFIEKYKERGVRLVQGSDLYPNPGDIKVISSTTTGAMGHYNRSNFELKKNDFVYTIDGANAGYILLFKPQKIWLTDHAGVVTVKDKYVDKYGKYAIAIFLQMFFRNNIANTGTQPKFVIKNLLNKEIDLTKLDALNKMNLEDEVCITI